MSTFLFGIFCQTQRTKKESWVSHQTIHLHVRIVIYTIISWVVNGFICPGSFILMGVNLKETSSINFLHNMYVCTSNINDKDLCAEDTALVCYETVNLFPSYSFTLHTLKSTHDTKNQISKHPSIVLLVCL